MTNSRTALLLLICIGMAAISTPALGQIDPRALYQENCAFCHGADLQGGNAQSLVDRVWQFGDEEHYIFENIKHGVTQLGMPAYEEALNDDQIEAVVEYIMNTEASSEVEEPPAPELLQSLDYEIGVEVLAEGLETPWAIDFPDEQTALVTERPGPLRVVRDGKLLPDPVADTPEVLHMGQGGMLDVAVDPDYSENGWIYLAYSHVLEGSGSERRAPAMTRIVRGRLRDNAWVDQQVVYEAPHETYVWTRHHYGCRIVFDPQGYLFFSIGDRGIMEHAQDLSRPNGKVHRIFPDGRVPEDNPFVSKEGALPTIFTYGNRNPQGLAVHPESGSLWETEHGPMGGDEVNLLRGGLNYGWPIISYGREYDGSIITELTTKPGLEQPNLYWRPSIAVCGLDFYRGDQFPIWRNALLVGALRYEEVRLLTIDEDRVMHQETILKGAGRVRDVACGPDGAIYVVLNQPGMVLRLTRNTERQY